jgi:hypothetical protein
MSPVVFLSLTELVEGALNFLNDSSNREAIVGIILISLLLLNGLPGYLLTVSGSPLISGGVEAGEDNDERMPKILKMEISDGIFDYDDITWAFYGGGLGEYFAERESISDGDTYYHSYQYSFKAKNQSTSNARIIYNLEEETFEGTISGVMISPNVTWGDYYESGYDHMGYVMPPNGLYAYQNTGVYSGIISGKLEPVGWHNPPESVQYRLNGTFEVEITYSAQLIAHKTISGGPTSIFAYYRVQEEKTISRTGIMQDTFSWHTKYLSLISGGFNVWMQDYENGPKASFHVSASGDAFFDLFEVLEWYEDNDFTISGPSTIEHSEAGEANFEVTQEAPPEIIYDSVEWVFSYKDDEGTWVDLEPFQSDVITGITVPWEGIGGLNAWYEALVEHGVSSEGHTSLDMRVKAKAYNLGEVVALSNTINFRYRVSEELQLTITGPGVVTPQTQKVQFNLTSEGPGIDLVRWVDWVFSYEDEYGQWGELETKMVEGDLSGIHVPKMGSDLNWEQWMEFASGQGAKDGDKKVMAMRVQAKAVSYDETELSASEIFEFSVESFKRFNITLPDSLYVYPTVHNTTKIEVDYGGTELIAPIKITLKDPLPAYLKIDLETDTVQPNALAFSEVSVNVTFDNSKRADPTSMSVPTIEKVTFIAKSGDYEASKELTLELYPPSWLIMYYIPVDTVKPPLQEVELANLLDVVKATDTVRTPKVAIVVMLDLNTSWPDPAAKDARLREAPPLEGATKRLEGNRASILQVVDGKLRVLRDVGPVNMGYRDVLNYFMDYAEKKFFSMSSMLIIGDHGAGITGIAWDGHQKGHLEIRDLSMVLANHYVNVLTFDACLMGQIEVLDRLKGSTKYIVASELPSPVEGLTYSAFIPMLLSDPNMSGETLAKKIVETYKIDKESHTAVAVPTREMERLTLVVNELGKQLKLGLQADPVNMSKIIKDVLKQTWKANPMPYIDFRDFAHRIAVDPRITSDEIKVTAELAWLSVDPSILSKKIEFWSLDLNFNMVKHDSTGLNGLSVFFWDKGGAGSNAAMANYYWNIYTQFPTFSNGGWGEFMKAYINATKPKSTTVKLTHPGHELFLNVYDSEGRHIGYDPDNPTKIGIDAEIDGALYLDMENGTTIIILPEEVEEFEVVVDGQFMEEKEEPYELTYSMGEGDDLIFEETREGTIEENTAHKTPVTLGTDALVIGETTIEKAEPELEPEPEPEEPKEETQGKGIPGFPLESILTGLIIVIVILWRNQQR